MSGAAARRPPRAKKGRKVASNAVEEDQFETTEAGGDHGTRAGESQGNLFRPFTIVPRKIFGEASPAVCWQDQEGTGPNAPLEICSYV